MGVAAPEAIAGLVLAGGEGSRIGGAKALVPLGGKPLIRHAIDRLAPQVDVLWLSVRGAPGPLAELGHALVVDDRPESSGPLAGIAAGLRRAAAAGYGVLAVVPCDTPFLPGDLVEWLRGGLGAAPVAIIAAERPHPAIGLWRVTALPQVEAAIHAGRLRLGALCRDLAAAEVRPSVGWPPSALFNVNTPEDLLVASRRLGDGT